MYNFYSPNAQKKLLKLLKNLTKRKEWVFIKKINDDYYMNDKMFYTDKVKYFKGKITEVKISNKNFLKGSK